jgi:hypothetical protein
LVYNILISYFFVGRNVALKADTNQSSLYELLPALSNSSNAVDGLIIAHFTNGTCSHTNSVGGQDENPNLNVMFPHPMTVNSFVIYNRIDDNCKYC